MIETLTGEQVERAAKNAYRAKVRFILETLSDEGMLPHDEFMLLANKASAHWQKRFIDELSVEERRIDNG